MLRYIVVALVRFLSLPSISSTSMQFAETKLAVGDERAHAEGGGERQRLAVIGFGVVRGARRGNVAAEEEGVGLVSPGA
jgi:hypothetical protein